MTRVVWREARGGSAVVRVMVVADLPPDVDGMLVDDGRTTVLVVPARTGPDWVDRIARVIALLLSRLGLAAA